MSDFNQTPLREPLMEGPRKQKLNLDIQAGSEPFSKKQRVLVTSKYQANTCDVGLVNDNESVEDFDDCENPYLTSQFNSSSKDRSGMASVVNQDDLNLARGGHGFSRSCQDQVTDGVKLEDLKYSLEKLQESAVTKKDFAELMVKFDSLSDLLRKTMLGSEGTSQSLLDLPSVLNQQNKFQATTLASAQIKKFCVVSHDGKECPLLLPQSVRLRIEATSSKRGICREILRYLHPEPHFFDWRTVTGKTKSRGKENAESPEETFEPIPALTVKFCLAAVNGVKPMDKSRFNQDVVHEELEKYDGDTLHNLSRAIIDIRKEDSKKKN